MSRSSLRLSLFAVKSDTEQNGAKQAADAIHAPDVQRIIQAAWRCIARSGIDRSKTSVPNRQAVPTGTSRAPHSLAPVDADTHASAIDADAQTAMLPQIMQRDERGGKAGRCAYTDAPARTEPIGDPADDRGADWRAAQGNGGANGHYATTHARFRR